MILATTSGGALRHASTGLGVVRYWTYTKHPLGEAWEASFPTTIYLVGCNPPYSVSLYCTGNTTKKVLYHSDGVCSATDPGGSYVISWDRRTSCPTDLSSICDAIEETGEVVVEMTTVDLCLTVDSSTLEPSKWFYAPGTGTLYSCSGCVEPRWTRRSVDGEIVCVQNSYDAELAVCLPTNGAMTGNSTDGWTKGGLHITPAGVVSWGCFSTASGPHWIYPSWITFGVSYSGAGSNIALDADFNCPVGSSTITVVAVNYTDIAHTGGSACCPEGTMCDDHAYVCDVGTIAITTSVKVGACT